MRAHTACKWKASLLNVSACAPWGYHFLCICIHTACNWTAFLRYEQECVFSDHQLGWTRRHTWGICGFSLLSSLSWFGKWTPLYKVQWLFLLFLSIGADLLLFPLCMSRIRVMVGLKENHKSLQKDLTQKSESELNTYWQSLPESKCSTNQLIQHKEPGQCPRSKIIKFKGFNLNMAGKSGEWDDFGSGHLWPLSGMRYEYERKGDRNREESCRGTIEDHWGAPSCTFPAPSIVNSPRHCGATPPSLMVLFSNKQTNVTIII